MYAVFYVGFAYVIAVFHHAVQYGELAHRLRVFPAFIVFIGIAVEGFIGKVIRGLPDNSSVAVEYGYLADIHRNRSVQKAFNPIVGFIRPAGYFAVGLRGTRYRVTAY